MLSGIRKPLKHAVFISGNGSTLQGLLEMQHQLDVALVVSNKSKANGLLKAKRFGIPILHFDKNMNYEQLTEILKKHKIDRIFLAGYMKLLPENFVNKWKNKIVNIHPSLLPKFPGLDAAENSWTAKADMGVSIHNVIPQMDEGEVILQKKSSKKDDLFQMSEAMLLIRKTEQYLLREYALRFSL